MTDSVKRSRTAPSPFLRFNMGKMTNHQTLLSVNVLTMSKVSIDVLHFNQSKFSSRRLSFGTNSTCNDFGRNQTKAHANDSTV